LIIKKFFSFDAPYFSCLDTRKVTKESQEILNSPAAQTIGFQKNKNKTKVTHFE